ncbi:beta-N-acetylglucosaminidase domain-containing protein [Prolixibacteraceae bacterium]|nr:beta-N-acetylglucosaminidase domain-containing protein [Prolixibacteraceae bacterium]
MNTQRMLILLVSFLTLTCYAEKYPNIYPAPQSTIRLDAKSPFDFASKYQLIIDKNLARDHKDMIKCLFPNIKKQSKSKVVIGLSKSRPLRRYGKDIPNVSGAYKIHISHNAIQLIGFDNRGVHYGLQTLSQLLNQGCARIEIIDFPDIKHRGVVEGFYGTPWSFEDRKRQLEFYGDCRLNTYIYGPKNDPFHSSPNWRNPYPKKEANEITALAEIAKKNRVDFIWAIHPGKDIQWTQDDQRALLDKLENMYELGVRGFAVFFDDISGIGTDPNKQTSLLNDIVKEFYKKHDDLVPLIMCPTEYAKSRSNPDKDGYLPILGDNMDSSIEVMWTGDQVVGQITKGTLNWVTQRIDRNAYIWWNYPVSDYCRHNLLLGPCYGLTNDGADKMNGFVANPMEYANASEISLFSVAEYAWNVDVFNAVDSWNRAIETLVPEISEEYKFFADFNVDPNASWGWRTGKESNRFRQFVECNEIDSLKRQFENMVLYSNNMLSRLNDRDLKQEVTPWLEQFRKSGLWGLSLLEQQECYKNNEIERFWELIVESSKIKNEMLLIGRNMNLGRGVEVGSSVLMPYLKKQDKLNSTKFISKLNGVELEEPILFGYATIRPNYGNVFDGDVNTTFTFKKNVQKDDFVAVDLKKPTTIRSIDIYQSGNRNHIKSGVFEYSNDGKKWWALSENEYQGPIVHFEARHKPVQARYIRYVSKFEQTDKKKNWVTIHDIFINRSEPYATLINSSRPFKNLAFRMDGNSLTFEKKLEIFELHPNQRIVLSFLKGEKIKNIMINLGTQYKSLVCFYLNENNQRVDLKKGVINGTYDVQTKVTQLVIENNSLNIQPLRLLDFKLVLDKSINMNQRLIDLDLDTAYPISPSSGVIITDQVKSGSTLLFYDSPIDLEVEITLKSGEVLKQNIKHKIYKVPSIQAIDKCKLINNSKYTIRLVEVL